MDGFVRIDGVAVDVDAICSVSHDCRPELCRTGACCCACYEVALTGREVAAVAGMLPGAARHASRLKEGGRFDNVFDESDEGGFVLDTTPDGACVFLYRDRARTPLCSLHTAAIESGAPPSLAKPRSCTLWPLALSEDATPVLGVQDDALGFPCNGRRKPGGGLDAGVASIIGSLFGEAFLARLAREVSVRRGVKRPRPSRGGRR
ncbi:MAG: DUF3109 family protein [Thermodesulfobacteriota bacterium]